MNFFSDFELIETGMSEFFRILVPEAMNVDFTVKTIYENELIKIEVSSNIGTAVSEYRNISNIIGDLKVILAKTAVLKIFNKNHLWGSLTGVRPTKLVRKLYNSKLDFDTIDDILRNLYLVSPQKSSLLISIVKRELEFLDPNFINIYVGIPFCPSRCSYCSFASYELSGTHGKYYKEFLGVLKREIIDTGILMNELGLKANSIYIGGGTPSVLSETELADLLAALRGNIDFSAIREFTLEAGRPDTITYEKLLAAKQSGVTRVSINPQTFNESTLAKLNRPHSIVQFNECFRIAKDLGFIVNTDFILGLPGETLDDMLYTIDKMAEYEMDNLTIHSLAIKRASKLSAEIPSAGDNFYPVLYDKLNCIAANKGMSPYYMYRQKNSLKDAENIGFATNGTESLFNMEMIEETQDTIGIGGGAITKLISGLDIKRIVNPKDPIMYIKEYEDRFNQKKLAFKEKYT